jgi:histone demethylase JARID1
VDNYRQLHRQCVFSHEEIICKMAADYDRLDLATATAVYQDLLALVDHEVTLRKQLLDKVGGIRACMLLEHSGTF